LREPGVVGPSGRETTPPFEGVVFDLDNTLLRTQDLPRSFVDPVVEAIVGRRPELGASEQRLRETLFRRSLERVAEDFDLSEAEYGAAAAAYAELEVTDEPLQLFPDARRALVVVEEWGLLRALMTRGFRRLQESKVERLALGDVFGDEIYIDALDDGPDRPGQVGLLSEVADRWSLPSDRIVVVGDDPDAELRAGRELGMQTVLVWRDGSPPQDTAHLVVEDLSALFGDHADRIERTD
jgi:putative hydrolase of the HAD superfamily